jgi:nitrogen fixation NifU-like protein
MFNELVMDHFRNPRNKGRMAHPDFSSDDTNPSCGDNVVFDAHVDATTGTITELFFEGKGCALSMATASMLTQACIGKKLAEILTLDKDYIVHLLSLELGPNRLKCALLPLKVLQQGVARYLEHHNQTVPKAA